MTTTPEPRPAAAAQDPALTPHPRSTPPGSAPEADPPPVRRLRVQEPGELLAHATDCLGAVPRDSLVLLGHRERRDGLMSTRLLLTGLLGPAAEQPVAHALQSLREFGCTGAFGIVVLGDGHEPTGGQDGIGRTLLRRVLAQAGPQSAPDRDACERELEEEFAERWRAGLEDQDLDQAEAGRAPEAEDDDLGAVLARELGIHIAARVLTLAMTDLPDPFDLPELWVLDQGTARCVRVEVDPGGMPGDVLVAIGPEEDLPDPRSTRVAVQGVLAGRPRVRTDPGRDPVVGLLRAHLADGRGTAADPGGAQAPRRSVRADWNRALAALAELRRAASGGRAPGCVTPCEPVREFVEGLASTRRRDQLLEHVLHRGQRGPRAGDASLIVLAEDPARRPDPSICAGGEWYTAMETIAAATRPAALGTTPAAQRALHAGWANLTVVLALCAWWNARFATAGAMIDDVLAHDPDHNLARLSARIVDGGLRPAWRPTAPW